MVSRLGKEGCWRKALEIYQSLPLTGIRPDTAITNAAISACDKGMLLPSTNQRGLLVGFPLRKSASLLLRELTIWYALWGGGSAAHETRFAACPVPAPAPALAPAPAPAPALALGQRLPKWHCTMSWEHLTTTVLVLL